MAVEAAPTPVAAGTDVSALLQHLKLQDASDIDVVSLPAALQPALAECFDFVMLELPIVTAANIVMGTKLNAPVKINLKVPGFDGPLTLSSSKPLRMDVKHNDKKCGFVSIPAFAAGKAQEKVEVTVYVKPADVDNEENKAAVRELMSSFVGGKDLTVTLYNARFDGTSEPPKNVVDDFLVDALKNISIEDKPSDGYTALDFGSKEITILSSKVSLITRATSSFPIRSFSAFRVKAAITCGNPFDIPVTVERVAAYVIYDGHKIGQMDTDDEQNVNSSTDFSIGAKGMGVRSPPYICTITIDWSAIAAILRTYRGVLKVDVQATMWVKLGGKEMEDSKAERTIIDYTQKNVEATLVWNIR